MSAEFNDILRQGYLKVKSKNIGVWNKRWVILKKASSKGPIRLEKYHDEEIASIQKDDPKATLLSNVLSVSRLPGDVKKHAFAIMFCDKQYRQYACDSELEADEWQKLLENACVKAIAAGTHKNVVKNGQEMFNVYLLPSPKLDIYGECLLHVSADHILLYDSSETNRRLASWPLTTLRKYGKDDSKFTIESGRHCDTGEGLFLFNTTEASRIWQKVHSASFAISEAHRLTSRTTEQAPLNGNTFPRGNFDQGAASQVGHNPLQISHSYPADTRAPLPLPRDKDGYAIAPPVPSRPRGSLDNNMPNSAFPTGTTFQVSYKQPGAASSPATNNNTLPMAAGADNTENQEIYIYEEKGLEPQFRKFLAVRKDDD